MSMREQYENLDQYAIYDYKDVSNAYGHGEDDAIDKVLEIIERLNHNGSVSIKLLRKELEALKSGMCL